MGLNDKSEDVLMVENFHCLKLSIKNVPISSVDERLFALTDLFQEAFFLGMQGSELPLCFTNTPLRDGFLRGVKKRATNDLYISIGEWGNMSPIDKCFAIEHFNSLFVTHAADRSRFYPVLMKEYLREKRRRNQLLLP